MGPYIQHDAMAAAINPVCRPGREWRGLGGMCAEPAIHPPFGASAKNFGQKKPGHEAGLFSPCLSTVPMLVVIG
jgi:hypothetical protein